MDKTYLSCATGRLFSQVAKNVVDFKMVNDIAMSELEIKMYHMDADEISEAIYDEGIVEYINTVATPHYIEDTFGFD